MCETTQKEEFTGYPGFIFFCGGFCHVSGRGLAPFNGANPPPVHKTWTLCGNRVE